MFEQLKEGLVRATEEEAISIKIDISIKAEAFNALLDQYPIDNVSKLGVVIKKGFLFISGVTTIKKLGVGLKIPFKVKLKPIHAENRILHLQLISLMPVDFPQINKMIFKRPPIFTYNDRYISVNLNAFDMISQIPFGQVKSLSAVDDQIDIVIKL